jgi:5-formyltetrahydrofolate cyclo-ligase
VKRAEKQALRELIWERLELAGVAAFPKLLRGRIPNFKGSAKAAERLCSLQIYRGADVVFVNPDSPQLVVREFVLRDGKRLIMASPKLRQGLIEITGKNLVPAEAASIRGAFKYGRPVVPWGLRIDLVVEGSVAVDPRGGRVGKGGGFGDLEFAILKEVRAISDSTPIATTVHELQLVERVPMQPHDAPVDLIITPGRELRVAEGYAKPPGILWELLRQDLLEEIPLLRELRKRLTPKLESNDVRW